MTQCKFCHIEIRWVQEGERSILHNLDGTRHNCQSKIGQQSDIAIVGRLDSYTTGSATFTIKGGIQKTYAITAGMAQEWKQAGILIPTDNHPDIWFQFSKDKESFIQPGWERVQAPDWGANLQPESPTTAIPKKGEDGIDKIVRETKERNEGADKKPGVTSVPAEKDVWSAECEEFRQLLRSTERDGIDKLLMYLESETDFFIAPSSTKYHDARDGGLLHHSLSTYHNLVVLTQTFTGDYPEDSLKIIGLLHDICKANFYKTSFRNVKKELPDGFTEWVKEPYIDIDDKFPLGHGEKSTILLLRHIALTDIEVMAIRWHMMAYDDIRCSYAGNLAITNASSKYPIIVLMHIADLSASFLETRPPKE